MDYKAEITDPNDMASQFARKIALESHNNCPAITVRPHDARNWRGGTGVLWAKHVLEAMLQSHNSIGRSVMLEEMENDGAGGKPQFFTLHGSDRAFSGLGWEVIVMCDHDFWRSGRFPAYICNQIDTKGLTPQNFRLFKAMMEGYGLALQRSGLANITGEIAICPNQITAFCDQNSPSQLIVTWGAAVVGLSHCDRLIDGYLIEPGMDIVGLLENGYRCNGGTWLTRLVLTKWGPSIDAIRNNPEAMDFIEMLTIPSVSYSSFLRVLIGWNPDASLRPPAGRVYGIAHITGGGLAKFQEALPNGIGACLDEMPRPPEVLLQAQRYAAEKMTLSDEAAYRTFHGGCGMMLVCHPDDTSNIIRLAHAHRHVACHVGKTCWSPTKEIRVTSRFRAKLGTKIWPLLPDAK
ncbi:MAG TPA: AIR synthase-related protein [Candidatus Paceibacterota bacterium]